MKIQFHRLFEKRYQKLSPFLQRKVEETIALFARDPFAIRLRNHALTGNLSGKRAISVVQDIRIIYETDGHHLVVIFLEIGSHDQVYR